MADNARLVRASEIGEYVFCRRAWWLHHVQGLESAHRAQREAGIAQHIEHGRQVQRAETMRRAAVFFIVLALVFAMLFVLALLASSS